MNRQLYRHIIASIIVLLLQIFLLKNVQVQFLDKFAMTILLYPAIIIFLPLDIQRSLVITLSFFIGLLIDVFYQSYGIHAAALVLTGFTRAFILKVLEPRQGYRINESPSIQSYGTSWFFTFLGIMLFIHTFTYFAIDAFSFVFFIKILVNSLVTFIVSYIILVLYKFLF